MTDPAPPTVDDALARISALLDDAGVPDPRTDSELILAHVLGETRGRIQALAVMGRALTAEQAERATELTDERARRVPLQHLTGRAPFRALELSVGPGVFVPRPETEGVAQLAIDALLAVPDPEPIAVDLCTGSGAIALSLAREVPTARVWAVEKSPEAHAWAARNVAEWGEGRVELLLGDVAELALGDVAELARESTAAPDPGSATPLAAVAALAGRIDVLASNPPYVPTGMVPRDPEVRDHDPEMALFSGADGLDLIRVISRVGRSLVRPGGTLVLEHAEHQGRAIRDILAADGWRAAATHPDLTGRDRATTALS
ncbi:peptide chain release factor N(5)-glutamine methyltransferase [Leucobacter luti]|uniref:peptide chain release factor N(5)-glutamine methyltransferase n=1 Tax=Leucobacter luti TaxID=340320 RepID=UPI003CFEC8D1